MKTNRFYGTIAVVMFLTACALFAKPDLLNPTQVVQAKMAKAAGAAVLPAGTTKVRLQVVADDNGVTQEQLKAALPGALTVLAGFDQKFATKMATAGFTPNQTKFKVVVVQFADQEGAWHTAPAGISTTNIPAGVSFCLCCGTRDCSSDWGGPDCSFC